MRQQIVFGLFLTAFSLLKVEFQAQTLPSYLPSNGLVGWWPFNGNANDESGNGNNGAVNGATLTADRNGNTNSAYSFDGIDDFIDLNSLNNAQYFPVTYGLWFKASQLVTVNLPLGNQVSLVGRDLAGTLNQGGIGFWNDPNYSINQRLHYYTGASGQLFDFSPNLNQWYHLIFVYNSDFSMSAYVDNNLIATYNFNGQNLSANIPFRIGAGTWFDGVTSRYNWNGIIDDVMIYNRALSFSEISTIFENSVNLNGVTAGTPAASVPAGIPYQAVIRDNTGAAMVNANVAVRFTLHENTTSGTTEYQETQSLTTNALGLINTQFGAGTATQGTFAGINWSNTTKFIQVEANTGAGYVDMGTQQMMSVPFAIQANKATAIKNAGLPVYADNAAALAGGLVAGEMYRTAAGILMIVF
jgi:hypothetical protein